MTKPGDAASAKLFLSCVSDEFGKREAPYGETRQALDKYLRRAGCQVESQEHFRQHGADTLDLLDDYIRGCRAVVHLVGEMPGTIAAEDSPEAVAKLREKLEAEGRPFLTGQPDALREAVGDGSDLSYTQWEAFLALHHGVDLFVYHTGNGPDAQADHLARLKQADPQRFGKSFADREDLLGQMIGDLRKILPDLPERKPFNLPGTIGELFKGRESFLETIRETLKSSPGTAITQKPQTISGLGGIGKTRLAIEFGYRHAGDYSALFFLSADSPESLRRNLAELTGPLVLDLPEFEADLETRLAAALRWLETHQRWFLILDNVDNEKAAVAVEELLPKLSRGDVLITSRLSKWRGQVKKLDLEVLDDAAAREFLLDRTEGSRPRADTDDADLEELIEELDGLALALEQAGAYIAEREIPFAEYLRRFREQKTKVLEWHDERAMHYPASVAATWQTSFEQLGDEARDLLNQLSFLAPEPIPRDMIPDEEPLIELKNLSLVRFLDDPPDGFVVHRLLQEIVRSRLDDEEAEGVWEKLIQLLCSWAPGGGQDISTWEKWAAFEPHAETVFDPDLPFEDSEQICSLLNGFKGFQQYRNANYVSAELLSRRALEVSERILGEEHPHTLAYLNNLAELLREKGEYEEAEPLVRRALEVRERVLGQEHPDTLSSLHILAALLFSKGKTQEAEPLFRRVLKGRQRVFGDQHSKTLKTLNNLAALLQAKGEFFEAEQLFRRALEVYQRVLENEHPDTLTSAWWLAVVEEQKGNRTEAEALYRRTLDGFEAKLGPDHPNTKTVRVYWENCVAEMKRSEDD